MVGHTVGELVHHGQQVLLGKVVGTGLHVNDPEAGLHIDHGGHVGVHPTGEHRGSSTSLGEGGGQLADVDVHPTTVTGSGLDQRRGV